jgi:hypothetical protein
MLRSVIILATLVAFFLGALDIPVYLHACRMMRSESIPATGCSMCVAKEQVHTDACAIEESVETSGPALKAAPCCRQQQVDRELGPTIVAKVEMPSPPAVSASLLALLLDDVDPASVQTGPVSNDRPPPLALRSQSAYLYNSTFLI